MTEHLYWSYDDEITYWQVYSDAESRALPRWTPEWVVRLYVRWLRWRTL